MAMWTRAEINGLAKAMIAAGDTFATRRVLQRLDRGELDVAQAIEKLELLAWTARGST
jgi:hypothetical protein